MPARDPGDRPAMDAQMRGRLVERVDLAQRPVVIVGGHGDTAALVRCTSMTS